MIKHISKFVFISTLAMSLFAAAVSFSAPAKKKQPAKPAAKAPLKQPKTLSAFNIIQTIQDNFKKQNFKTLTYDETRTASYELDAGKSGALMTFDMESATTYKLRYFYRAPDTHGYHLLTKEIKNYWIGSPTQPGALPMSENWEKKVLDWYDVMLSDNQVYRGRVCYVLILLPRPNAPKYSGNMQFYIDPASFVVLKFIVLAKNEKQTISTNGDIYYKKINGYLMPSSARIKAKISTFPYTFNQYIIYDNYRFNIPLDNSVFNLEFPKNWFENMRELNGK